MRHKGENSRQKIEIQGEKNRKLDLRDLEGTTSWGKGIGGDNPKQGRKTELSTLRGLKGRRESDQGGYLGRRVGHPDLTLERRGRIVYRQGTGVWAIVQWGPSLDERETIRDSTGKREGGVLYPGRKRTSTPQKGVRG